MSDLRWRVGRHYSIHVYEDERPVATFHTAVDAKRAVAAVNAAATHEGSMSDIDDDQAFQRRALKWLEEHPRPDIEQLLANNKQLRAALIRARGFIQNGIALGYIRMPDPDTPDTAHELPGLIDAALEKTA